MHPLPGAVPTPAPEVLVDKLPWRQVMWHQTPRTAAAQDIKDAVEDLPLGVFLRPATGFGFRYQTLNQVPF
jgi:hypothetical protein